MKYPKRIKYRGRVLATIYGRCKGRDSYRVAWHVAGQRRMASFPSYSLAKRHADGLVKGLAKGSQVTALTPGQARDALAAIEQLETFRQATGRKVSLFGAASEFVASATKLDGYTMVQAIDGFLNSVASVKRIGVSEAVEEFLAIRDLRTKAEAGKRAQLSTNYAYIVGLWLRDFAATLPNTAVCDLRKEHLNFWIQKFGKQSSKSRNHYRAAVKMFLRWCVKRDYLAANHRLFDADGFATETADGQDIEFYGPDELRTMLDGASKSTEYQGLLPVLALGGLAGLRLDETLRLDWKDVWRVRGHIEVNATKAKTRARRLVKMCPALAQWLKDYRQCSGPIFAKHKDTFHSTFTALRQAVNVAPRRNGLRHAFVTFHLALHADENLTAQQAGNSPAMIHGHYKGLATKMEAKRWFRVKPVQTAKNIVPFAAVKGAVR